MDRDAEHPKSPLPSQCTPPRNTNLPTFHSTPLSHKVSGSHPFSSEPTTTAATMRKRLASEVAGHFIGPMPPKDFLEEFLGFVGPHEVTTDLQETSNTPIPPDIFDEVPKQQGQKAMFEALNSAASTFTSPKLVYTHSHRDPNYQISADIALYDDDTVSSRTVTSFAAIRAWCEIKGDKDSDPFIDPPEGTNNKTWTFERDSDAAVDTRGQLASYAAAHLDSSFRLYSISLLILGGFARFIRWDRSSAIVTEKFDYTKNPNLLANFLRCISSSSLGVDPTVTEASEEETRLAADWTLLKLGQSVHKITIPSRDNPADSEEYLIPISFSKSTSPFGRGARSTIAVRVRDQKRVFVKDYWRVDADGLYPEGEIYRRLEEAKVPHIAEFDRGNDIPEHQTIGHRYSKKVWACKVELISEYLHYRMSLDTVGRDLISFHSTSEYTQAIADAMEAHTAAYFDAKVLHRDISAGNILITDNGGGILIDWHLSAVVDDSGASIRIRKRRTGTWQFISCHILQNIGAKHTLLDDRESCLWVLIWITLRYSSTDLSWDDMGEMLAAFDYCYVGETYTKGGREKASMLMAKSGEIKLPDSRSGLRDLIQTLKESFAVRYVDPKFAKPFQSELAAMGNRDWINNIFKAHLAKGNWPKSDKAEPQCVPPNALASTRKRSSNQAELESRVSRQFKVHRSSQQQSSRVGTDEGFCEGEDEDESPRSDDEASNNILCTRII